MNLDEDIVKARIERIHRNKHDVNKVVRSVVIQPIEDLMEPSTLSSSVPDTVKDYLPEVKKTAVSILKELSNIGETESENPNTQLLQLENQISSIEKNILPKIAEVVSFYKEFDEKGYYFAQTISGETARESIKNSIKYFEQIREKLLTLNDTGGSASIISCDLFRLIESAFDGFDYLKANIEYLIDDRSKVYRVILDENSFSQKVLSNIKWNIQAHAFPKSKYKNILVTEKRVRIRIVEEIDFVRIIIENNGDPYEGDETKACDYGYCYGATRHEGFGLNSAKTYMKSIGGDLFFKPIPNSEFKVKNEITIKKA